MAAEQIGINIAGLRSAKGVKQDDVAKAVGVSAQAVSKWENGGTPDAELLPLIADYFGVSIDRLFGRKALDCGDIITEVTNFVARPLDTFESEEKDIPDDVYADAMARAMEICWAAKLGLAGSKVFTRHGVTKQLLDDIRKSASDGMNLYAKNISNIGMALMSLSKEQPYFMLFPEPKRGFDFGLSDLEEYRKTFDALADPNVLRCLRLIHTKETKNSYSLEYLAKMVGLDADAMKRILETLADMSFIEPSFIELDEAQQTIYGIKPSYYFVALLILMKTFMRPPAANINIDTRSKPFLPEKSEGF